MSPDLPPPDSVELGDCADLWLMNESEVDDAVRRYHVIDMISEEERLRYQRLRSARARRQHLGARMLTRYVLAAYTGVTPKELRFQAGPFGRPELVSNPLGLDFNISHTDGLIGCILTRDQRCGLDLEQTPAQHETAAAILQFLATEEQNHVRSLPESEQDLAVLDYWVIKEAYLKALGVGFTRAVNSFVVRGVGGPTIMIDDPASGGQRGWQLELRQLRSEHRLAVALAHPLGTSQRTPIRILDFAAFLRVAAPEPQSSANQHPEETP
ncbi:MAG TPA: 4'-phosphopantetheinyl transferase superfamily protein [Kineosporiaceae bacterium]|nr:4'-phosphopantetheinyl transferase superfamily protein [Kineosporiaceae bacterium]